MHRAASFVKTNTESVRSLGYYDTAVVDQRWVITRRSNGHVFCICRSQAEAKRLAAALNNDYWNDNHRSKTE
jgi:hypothetical protein